MTFVAQSLRVKRRVAFRVLFACAVAVFLSVIAYSSKLNADDNLTSDQLQEQMRILRAENLLLHKTLETRNRQVDEMQAELKRIKSLLDRAGVDTRTEKPAAEPTSANLPAVRSGGDPNTNIACAVQAYQQTVNSIRASDETDVQKKTKWVEATKALDLILKANRAVVSGRVEDVEMNRLMKSTFATIRLSSMRIEPTDAAVASVDCKWLTQVQIEVTEVEAGKITRGTPVTVEGMLTLNVDLSAPVVRQPALKYLSSYQLASFPGPSDTSSYSSHGCTIMFSDGCAIKVNDIARKQPVKSQVRTSKSH